MSRPRHEQPITAQIFMGLETQPYVNYDCILISYCDLFKVFKGDPDQMNPDCEYYMYVVNLLPLYLFV